MHEYSFVNSIIKTAERVAMENKATRITRIKVVVGELSGYIGDSIEFYFGIISKGTIAEDAILEIKLIKLKLFCEYCNKNFVRDSFSFRCPDCGREGRFTDTGKECYIEAIELEFEDEDEKKNY